jgi:hypothetical protein
MPVKGAALFPHTNNPRLAESEREIRSLVTRLISMKWKDYDRNSPAHKGGERHHEIAEKLGERAP